MKNFKKVLIFILIAFTVLLQYAGACFAQNHHTLRVPILTNSQKGKERLRDAFSVISSFNKLYDGQLKWLMESRLMLEEGYLAIKG